MRGRFNQAFDSVEALVRTRLRGEREAEELFELAVEACPSGMMMTDRGGRIIMANSEIEHLFGHDRNALIGQPVEMLLPPEIRSGHVALRAEFINDPRSNGLGKGRELIGRHRDGTDFQIEIGLFPIHIRDGLLILAVIVDISERKKNERLKDEFVSTVSHELRTPLTSIAASLALLAAGGAGPLPETAAHLIGIAHSNSQRHPPERRYRPWAKHRAADRQAAGRRGRLPKRGRGWRLFFVELPRWHERAGPPAAGPAQQCRR